MGHSKNNSEKEVWSEYNLISRNKKNFKPPKLTPKEAIQAQSWKEGRKEGKIRTEKMK